MTKELVMRGGGRSTGFVFVVLVGLLGLPITAQSQSAATASATQVVNAFHAAMKSGNAVEVMRLIASDAQLLEAGAIETRAEFEKNHLPADLQFEKANPGKRGPSRVTVVGDAAWAITTTEYKGTSQSKPLDMIGVELLVLSRDAAGWRIRAVHWSGRSRLTAP